MEKRQKLEAIEKMIRELDDVKNSQASLLKKVLQIETENINIGIDILDKELGDFHEKADATLEHLSQVIESMATYRDDFVKKNKLDVPEEVQ